MRPPVDGNLYDEVVSEKRAAEWPLVVVRLIRTSLVFAFLTQPGRWKALLA